MTPEMFMPLLALVVASLSLCVSLWADKEVRQATKQIEDPAFGNTKESPDA